MKKFFTAASIALLPLAASAATIIIPAAGTGPGANGTQWKSDVTIHNTSSGSVAVTLVYHDQNGADPHPVSINIPARATTTLRDVVKSSFARESGTGAVEIAVDDAVANKITITSRTFNTSTLGEFGQDIPAVASTEAAVTGDMVVLQAPADAAANRFNTGFYALTDSTVRFELLRANGTVDASSQTLEVKAGAQTQVNNAVAALFGREAQNDDAIHMFVVKGSVIAYGSAVNNLTGDPTFVPAIESRRDIVISFAGVDLDENGTVDIADANHDGILDAPVTLYTSTFPNFFRLVVDGGDKPTFELVDSTPDAIFADDNGTIEWAAAGDMRGRTGAIKVKITVGGQSEIITIPAIFR